jgi:hypothetical protein
VSAIGLEPRERAVWPYLRERLRQPGHLMALMRGVLGDTEIAAVVAVTPQGAVTPLAVLTTAEEIAAEIRLAPEPAREPSPGPSRPAGDGRAGADAGMIRPARVGDYDVQVVLDEGADGQPKPVAILTTPWIEQHLLLFARTLWRRR